MHRPAEPGDRLRQSIEQGTAVIGIVGMGYVGLPLMLAVTAKDYRVLGFDIDAPKVEGLNRGRSPLKHIGDAAIEKVVAAGRFEATADLSRFGEADIVIICVPTPLGPHQEPDLSFVTETTRSIAKCLRRGKLVILEIDHLSRYDGRDRPSDPRSWRHAIRRRFLPRILAGARRPGQRRLH